MYQAPTWRTPVGMKKLSIALAVLLAACTSSSYSPDKSRCADVINAVSDWQKGVKTEAEMRSVLNSTYGQTVSSKPYYGPLQAMLAAETKGDGPAFTAAARQFGAACNPILG